MRECGAEDNHGGLAPSTMPWSTTEFKLQILSSPCNSAHSVVNPFGV
jgi:hypothetical protein